MFAYFCGVNTPTMADLKLAQFHHLVQSGEEMCTFSFCELERAVPAQTLHSTVFFLSCISLSSSCPPFLSCSLKVELIVTSLLHIFYFKGHNMKSALLTNFSFMKHLLYISCNRYQKCIEDYYNSISMLYICPDEQDGRRIMPLGKK